MVLNVPLVILVEAPGASNVYEIAPPGGVVFALIILITAALRVPHPRVKFSALTTL